MARTLEEIKRDIEARIAQQSATPPVESQKFRTAMQGVTYNFADEIEAAVRSVLPESLGGGEYEKIRNELRQKLSAYKEENPKEALSYELAGALVPAIGMMAVPGGQALGGARLAAVAGAEGLGSYLGEVEEFSDVTPGGAALATGISAIGGPVAQKALSATGAGGSQLIKYVRGKFGDAPATAVQAELRRLAEATGQSVDEVIQDVMDGRIMAENKTLQASIRALRSKGGGAAKEITEQIPARRQATRAAAMEGMQEELAPGMSGNVIKAMKSTDEELGRLEREAYEAVFGGIPNVNTKIAREIESILGRFPDARRALTSIYNKRNTVPLWNEGRNILRRVPTLEDAEIVRRLLDDEASVLFRAGSGTEGAATADVAKALREMLDESYAGLRSVRADAAVRREMRDQFAAGRKAIGMNADELDTVFDEVKRKGDAAVRAFRAGVMDSIRNVARRRPGLMGRLADPELQEGAVLRVVFPDESIEQIQKRLEIAAGSQDLYGKVFQNSMTAPEQAARSLMGTGDISAFELREMLTGNPAALISGLGKMISKSMPEMSDADRTSVARVLLSEDPQLVMRALKDNTELDKLLAKIQQVIDASGKVASTGVTQQTGGLLAEGNF
jgi:hypothetical protein